MIEGKRNLPQWAGVFLSIGANMQKIEQKKLEKQLILEKEALSKTILINQSLKPKTEIRLNNDGSICKFLY